MKKDVVIKVEGLSKKYQIGERQSYLTLRDQLATLPNRILKKQKKKEFWALTDINFEVKKGEVIGIIGRNGAGKSTLLKILSKIVEPTKGRVVMRGRVASLLEVGTGFNQELTGRENIYLNGAILGMGKKEITKKFNEIVKFSGVEKFLDTPIKRYSSGMYVRLAFAVAAHLESDILLIDEVLAVGDAEFQKKCLEKMKDLAGGGRTVIFVSHNMNAINRLCKNVIYLDKGKIIEHGLADKILSNYFNSCFTGTQSIKASGFKGTGAKILEISIFNKTNRDRIKLIKHDKKLFIDLKYQVSTPIKALLSLMFFDESGSFYLLTSERDISGQPQCSRTHSPGTYSVQIIIPSHIFISGRYTLIAQIDDPFQKTFFKTNEIGFVVNQHVEPLNKLWSGKVNLKTSILVQYLFKKL